MPREITPELASCRGICKILRKAALPNITTITTQYMRSALTAATQGFATAKRQPTRQHENMATRIGAGIASPDEAIEPLRDEIEPAGDDVFVLRFRHDAHMRVREV